MPDNLAARAGRKSAAHCWLAGSRFFASLGIGAMIVVLVSMTGSLSVLPALLAKLDVRVVPASEIV